MDKSYTRDEVIKQNMIDLVTEHKKNVTGYL